MFLIEVLEGMEPQTMKDKMMRRVGTASYASRKLFTWPQTQNKIISPKSLNIIFSGVWNIPFYHVGESIILMVALKYLFKRKDWRNQRGQEHQENMVYTINWLEP